MQTFRPQDYGATPYTGLMPATDARPGIQAAWNAAVAAGGGIVDLGPYDWLVTRSPPGTYNHFACISCHGANVTLRGVSELETRIIVTGDAGAQTLQVIALDPGSRNILLEKFTIDTTGLTNTDANEQTHAIQIGSAVFTPSNGTDHMPVRDVTLRDITFFHAPATPGMRWGDAVRLGGANESTPVINVKLLNLNFLKVGRSAFAGQRNVNGVLIQGCYFDADNIGGTAIDCEMTPGSGQPTEWPSGLIVQGCTIVRRAPGGDSFAISLTSQRNFSIIGNTLIGRGISMVRATDGVVADNSIDATDQLKDLATVAIDNLTRDVVFSNNTIRRRGAAGPAVKAQPRSGVFPGDLVFDANAITNETDGPAFMLSSPRDTIVSGNKMTLNGSAAATGIYVDAGQRDVENLVLANNSFRGATYAPIRLVCVAPKPATPTTPAVPGKGFLATMVIGNVSRASGPGIRVDNATALQSGGVVVGPNNWSTPGWSPAP